MKALKISALALLLGSLTLTTACKKYEEGPSLSLRTKKARLTGDWDMVAYSYNGVEQADTEADVTTFEKDGKFSVSFDGFAIVGTWEFGDKKETLKVTIDGQEADEPSTIMKLTNKELWIKDTDEDGTVSITKYEKK